MKIDTIEYEKINETVHVYEHESGLKTFVINKKGYSKKHASFAAHFGSINNEFIAPGDSEATKVPGGVAHFLEHKLFEQKDGSVMDKFAGLGAMPNAFTGFNQTVYLFSCTERFNENFGLLLHFVQNPYITEESVEKEKGIIEQEIKMYGDNPWWRSFFNLLGAFYEKNPVKVDIAGTVEDIERINRDVLLKCYNTFYHPSNMVIVVVGDTDHIEVFEQVRDGIGKHTKMPEIKRMFHEEPDMVRSNYVEQKLAVSTPHFQMGFKDNQIKNCGTGKIVWEVSVKALLEMIMGRSSKLYEELYGEGLINHTFGSDYTSEENYAFSMFGGESTNPEKARDMIVKKINETHDNGLDKNSFERVKKALYGRSVRQLNSIESISHSFISAHFKEINMFDYLEVYDKISFEYIKEVFNSHFNPDNLALSVIRPV